MHVTAAIFAGIKPASGAVASAPAANDSKMDNAFVVAKMPPEVDPRMLKWQSVPNG